MSVNRARPIDEATRSSSSKSVEGVIIGFAPTVLLVSTRAVASNDVQHQRSSIALRTCSRMSGEIRHLKTSRWSGKLTSVVGSSRCELHSLAVFVKVLM